MIIPEDKRMEKKAILVIDADPKWEEFRLRLQKSLAVELIQVANENRGRELFLQQKQLFLLVALSETLPAPAVTGLIAEFKQEEPFLPVFIVSPHPTVEGAVAAMRRGAQDYLPSPMTWERLKEILSPYLRNGREPWRVSGAKRGEESKARDVITQDPIMLQLLRMAETVAPTQATVLLQGESGTGKEIMARYIHSKSDRSQGPFIAVNCASLPEGLLESELFGHEKGAYTGAAARREGRFLLAHRGTLFLDEVGELSLPTQAKILRVLQTQEFEPLGSNRTLKVDVRIIAATNRDLEKAVREGHFREDLFYRLNVFPLTLPPLRERREDLPLLAAHFLKLYGEKHRKEIKALTPEVMQSFQRYGWPGNIRELENFLERGVILCQSEMLTLRELPRALQDQAYRADQDEAGASDWPDLQRELISRTLKKVAGDRRQAGDILGISQDELDSKIRAYGLDY